MVVTDRWLIDKSAYARLDESPDFDLWLNRINRGFVYASSVTLLEMGWSARTGRHWHLLVEEPPTVNLLIEYLTPAMEDRALELQGLLADRGQHRAPSIPDLLIAATAEVAGMTVLHVDRDFDLVGSLTGQPLERLRGDW
jgi:hypothetical protein